NQTKPKFQAQRSKPPCSKFPSFLLNLAKQSKANLNSERNKEDNMRFFILISLFRFAVFALANPGPDRPAARQHQRKTSGYRLNSKWRDSQTSSIRDYLGLVWFGFWFLLISRHVDELLDDKSTKITKNLLMTAGPAITPELLKKVSGLLDNGSKLLTPDFVDQTKNLIKKASNVCASSLYPFAACPHI
ncbi:hypothetical protein ACJ73_05524, partial [Blastomyces percursus]